jgi:hypothetical protein
MGCLVMGKNIILGLLCFNVLLSLVLIQNIENIYTLSVPLIVFVLNMLLGTLELCCLIFDTS